MELSFTHLKYLLECPYQFKRHLLLRYADEETAARMESLAAQVLTDYLRDNAAILHQVQFADTRWCCQSVKGGLTTIGARLV